MTPEQIERIRALLDSWKESVSTKHDLVATDDDYENVADLLDAYREMREAWETYQADCRPETRNDFLRIAKQALGGNDE